MVAAAATVWVMFALWVASPILGLPRAAQRLAAALVVVELLMLMAWGYGTEYCAERTCAPVAQAFGVGARIDVPLLAALFLALTVRALYRAARAQAMQRRPAPQASWRTRRSS